MTTNPEPTNLWVRVRDGGREARLAGDTHTHPGRFLIQYAGDTTQRLCSLYKIPHRPCTNPRPGALSGQPPPGRSLIRNFPTIGISRENALEVPS